MSDVTVFATAAGIGIAYSIIGLLQGLSQGEKFDPTKLLKTIIAVLFVAAVDPSLIPQGPTTFEQISAIAVTAFGTFGAIYVIQKLASLGHSILSDLEEYFKKPTTPTAPTAPPAH